jgi:tRNA A-37 threonylcarbamoyl transferase component Bud32/tetratricopeptide (TPR) repeat protein
MMIGSETIIGMRYILKQPLGTGGMGAVFRAQDRLMGGTIALKRIRDDESTRSDGDTDAENQRLALAQEFRVLSSLRHPNIISVIDYGFDEDKKPFYTMELLEGAQNILEAGRGRSLSDQLSLIAQVLQALRYLHRRGVIHRDLKPHNVLVVNDQVKVLDFGLSVIGDDSTINAGSTTAGTLAYMAPEVLMGQAADESADLYAVGMMVFELVAGHHPFDTGDITALINQLLYGNPDVSELDVHPDLKFILERLLARDRVLRFKDAAEVLREMGSLTSNAIFQESAATRESFLQAARLVERDAEVSKLSAALSEALAGRGGLWLVSGESGVGKSRLLDEVRALALVRGALVLRGQAIAEGGSPYFLWRSVLRWLVMQPGLPDEILSPLKILVPDIHELLGRPVPDAPELAPRFAHQRFLDAFQGLFTNLKQPTLILLEDMQWAAESLDVLIHLSSYIGKLSLLVVGSFRDDERPELAGRIPGAHVLRLRRLSDRGIAQLSEAMLGENGKQPHVLELLQRETEGNVFFLVEVVRLLAEEAGQLDRIGLVTLPASVLAGGIKRVIERRLGRIPESAMPLLQFAAVMGRWLDVSVLGRLSPDKDIQQWLADCSDAAVLEVFEDRWRFTHDKLREGVLELIESDRRPVLHGLIAAELEALRADESETWPMLAFHFGLGGEKAKEARYGVLAGTQALKHGAYRNALVYFDQALQLAITTGQIRDQISFKSHIASAHLGLGEYRPARKLYQENLITAHEIRDDLIVADSLLSLGSVSLVQGEPIEARQYLEEALRLFEVANDLGGQVRVCNRLGDAAYELGEVAVALAYFQRSLEMSRKDEKGWGMAGAIRDTSELKIALQPPSKEVLKDMIGAARKSNDSVLIIQALWAAIRWLFVEHQHTTALELLSLLIHHPAAGDILMNTLEELSFELEAILSTEEYSQHWETGKGMSIWQGVDVVSHLL